MKKYIPIAIFITVLLVMPAISAWAAPNLGLEYAGNLGLRNANGDPRDMLVSIVRYFLTFISLAAVVVILLGGLRLMTSMGNDDRIMAAKQTIYAGLIGLIIVLLSFAIVNFVTTVTGDAINGSIVT